jgi:hypothetical protein
MNILTELSKPFDPAKIEWRVGSTTRDKTRGMALAYIDARMVQDRLNEVCGHLWQCRYSHVTDKRVTCEIGIHLSLFEPSISPMDWIWRADGAGDTDFEGEKGALSDAFKRAAVKWGVGRYLYDKEAPWVSIIQKGNSYAIADSDMERLAGSALTQKPLETRKDAEKSGRYIKVKFKDMKSSWLINMPEDDRGQPDDFKYYDMMIEAIDGMDSVEALTKLMNDNAPVLTGLSKEMHHEIVDASAEKQAALKGSHKRVA